MNNQECAECGGTFHLNEKICEGDNGKLYCEACFEELEEAHEHGNTLLPRSGGSGMSRDKEDLQTWLESNRCARCGVVTIQDDEIWCKGCRLDEGESGNE